MPLAIHMEQVKEVDHQQQPTPYGYKAIMFATEKESKMDAQCRGDRS